MTNSQLDTTSKSQEVSPFPAGDHKAHINRRTQRQSNHKTENIKDPQKKYRLGTVSKKKLEGLNRFHGAPTSPLVQMWIKTHTQNINNTNDPQKKYRLRTVNIFLLEGLNRFHGAPTTPLIQMWFLFAIKHTDDMLD